jgi:hypothetical protein
LGLALTLVFVLGMSAEQAGKGKKPALPKYFSKLGLSAEQKAKVYDVLTQYAKKIDALEEQLAQLKAERDRAAVAVLTEQQRKMYLELLGIDEKDKGKKAEDKKGSSGS